MKLAFIEWEDSALAAYGGWKTGEGVYEHIAQAPCHCLSVGWVFHNGPRMITLVASRNGTEEFTNIVSIPKSCIRKLTYLKEPK